MKARREPLRSNCGAPLDELLDGGGAFFHQGADGGMVAKAVAGLESVLLVQLDFVVVAEGYGDAALGVFGGRFAEALLGDYQHRAAGRQIDGGAQTGDAGAND